MSFFKNDIFERKKRSCVLSERTTPRHGAQRGCCPVVAGDVDGGWRHTGTGDPRTTTWPTCRHDPVARVICRQGNQRTPGAGTGAVCPTSWTWREYDTSVCHDSEQKKMNRCIMGHVHGKCTEPRYFFSLLDTAFILKLTRIVVHQFDAPWTIRACSMHSSSQFALMHWNVTLREKMLYIRKNIVSRFENRVLWGGWILKSW